MRAYAIPILALSTLLAGCLEDLPSAANITYLRVIGIRAEPPEAEAGDTVALEALVVDPLGRDVTITWQACVRAERASGMFGGSASTSTSGGRGYGLEDPGACSDVARLSPGDFIGELGTGPKMTLQIPDWVDDPERVAAFYGFAADSPELLLLVQYFVLPYAGTNVTVSVRAEAGGEVVDAFKWVNVSTDPLKNTNPDDFLFHFGPPGAAGEVPKQGEQPPGGKCFLGEGGEPLSVQPGTYRLRPMNIPDPPVEYDVLVIDQTILVGGPDTTNPEAMQKMVESIIQPREETLFYSFFSTKGSFDRHLLKSTGEAVEWTLSAEDLGDGDVPIWIVTRDGRGGTSWCKSLVRAE